MLHYTYMGQISANGKLTLADKTIETISIHTKEYAKSIIECLKTMGKLREKKVSEK